MYKKPADKTKLKAPAALALFILPLPLMAVALGALTSGDYLRLLYSGVGLAGYYLAGMLVRRSHRDVAETRGRKFVPESPTPFKTLASLLAGAATVFTALTMTDYSLAHSVLLGMGTAAGVLFTYGLDPRRTKINISDLEVAKQAAETLAAAESRIIAIEKANARIDCPELTDRLDTICIRGREILDILEDNPKDIRRARKFMNTYLEGAESVIERYAATSRHGQSQELDANFRNVLSTIETVFVEQKQKLLERDRTDLDVQIEVLTTQMEREGVQ
ncbi:MAG: hypothetical protein DHS20C11_01550 [Lysobacteraceae bacterium]|nr:MAG: hypothetical protein DHS20C11_01550 [Xanthomonadaceae bacterium]